jgi:hypothetical protein
MIGAHRRRRALVTISRAPRVAYRLLEAAHRERRRGRAATRLAEGGQR